MKSHTCLKLGLTVPGDVHADLLVVIQPHQHYLTNKKEKEKLY